MYSVKENAHKIDKSFDMFKNEGGEVFYLLRIKKSNVEAEISKTLSLSLFLDIQGPVLSGHGFENCS